MVVFAAIVLGLVWPVPPRVATTPPADKAEVIRKADAVLAKPPELPEGNGGWIFDYACPKDAAQLRSLSLTEHECPVCRARYTNEKVVMGYRCTLHYGVEHAAEALGWAHQLTGDEKYVPGVKRILLKLAGDYPSYPDRLDRWGVRGGEMGGRRYVQSLDEAVGAIRLAKAYDLTRNSPAWTNDEHRRVQEFFRATAESVGKFTRRSNHQTWYNAGLIAIASTLADTNLLERTMTGVLDQLEHNVGRDGLWYEGAMVYHNYALHPLVMSADMVRPLGMKLHEHPKLRAMITGPVHAAYPDGSFPAVNDSDPAHWRMLEWAYKWAGLPLEMPKLGSEVLADAGLVALRAGGACVFVDYGGHGDEHGHPDKLNIMLFAQGREWILDPGRITYSVPEYKTWARTTVAHNTVVIDERDQQPTTGELLRFGSNSCVVASSGAYPGYVLKRFLALREGYLIDAFSVKGDQPAQLDWLVHCRGKVGTNLPAATLNYPHLRDVQTGKVSQLAFDQLRIHFAGEETVFTGTGIGYRLDDRVPFVLRRRHGNEAVFITVYDWSGDVHKIEWSAGRLLIHGVTNSESVAIDL